MSAFRVFNCLQSHSISVLCNCNYGSIISRSRSRSRLLQLLLSSDHPISISNHFHTLCKFSLKPYCDRSSSSLLRCVPKDLSLDLLSNSSINLKLKLCRQLHHFHVPNHIHKGMAHGCLRSRSIYSLHLVHKRNFHFSCLSTGNKGERANVLRNSFNHIPLSGLSRNKSSYLDSSHDGKSLVNQFLFVKTLHDFYEDIPNGIVIDTAYADSRPNADFDQSLPVIVGLHDTPGDHRDLVPLLEFFSKIGCRTVCPTFPGHGQSRSVMRGHNDIFSQSTLERANFVNDFLANLEIESVDILVGVGASCYTAMTLCTHETQVFKSAALISPWPISKPRFATSAGLLERLKELWDMQLFRPLLRLLLPAFKIGTAKSTQEKIALAYLLSSIDLGEAYSQSVALSMKRIPYILAYGGQDRDMDQSLYDEIVHNLEIGSNAVTTFNNNQSLNETHIPGALVFPAMDSSQILTQQRGVLCAYLLKLLQSLHPNVKI